MFHFVVCLLQVESRLAALAGLVALFVDEIRCCRLPMSVFICSMAVKITGLIESTHPGS